MTWEEEKNVVKWAIKCQMSKNIYKQNIKWANTLWNE